MGAAILKAAFPYSVRIPWRFWRDPVWRSSCMSQVIGCRHIIQAHGKFYNQCFINKKYAVLCPPLTQRGPTNSDIQDTVVCLNPSTCNKMQCSMTDSIQWLQDLDWCVRIKCVSIVQCWQYCCLHNLCSIEQGKAGFYSYKESQFQV